MTDITEYTTLKRQAKELYTNLKQVRDQIKQMESRMLVEIQQTQRPLTVIAENRRGIIRLQDRSRRLPLTQLDLKDKLKDCLREKFHNVANDSIEDFAESISKRIWSERRVKREQRVSFKAW